MPADPATTTAKEVIVTSPEAIAGIVRTEISAAAQRPSLLSRKQIAQELGVCVRTVAYLMKKGMPYTLLGASPRFILADVLVWQKASAITALVAVQDALLTVREAVAGLNADQLTEHLDWLETHVREL